MNLNPTTDAVMIVYPDGIDQPGIELRGTGFAVRCAAAIASENIPDALWTLEVLNRFGSLVPHPSQETQILPFIAKRDLEDAVVESIRAWKFV